MKLISLVLIFSGQIFTDVVGSPYYVAPEVLLKRYGLKLMCGLLVLYCIYC